MDLTYSDTEQTLASTARDFLEDKAPYDRVRQAESSETGLDDELWKEVVRNGWTEIPFDEEATLSHLAVLLGEFGAAAVASPFFQTTAAAGVLLRRLGNTDRARMATSRIADGARAALLTSSEPGGGARASRTDAGFRVDGGTFVVEWAHVADVLVCPVRLEDDTYTLLAIDPASPGVTIKACAALDNERVAQVLLRDVTVPNSEVLTDPTVSGDALDESLALVRLLRAAELVGCIRRVLGTTVEYVQARHQFGRALGSFQAVQHACADMRAESDGAFLATWEALSLADAGRPFLREAATATFFTGRAAERVTIAAAQLHGGMGFMAEYHLQFYFRRAKAQRLRLGTTGLQLERAAKRLLDGRQEAVGGGAGSQPLVGAHG